MDDSAARQKGDTSAAKLWIMDTLCLSPGNSILKADLFRRFSEEMDRRGIVAVSEPTLLKHLDAAFPTISKERQGRFVAFEGISWKGESSNTSPPPSSFSSTHCDIGPFLANLRSTVPTLRRVPKGARSTVARALSSTLQTVIATNTCEAWDNLFLFPYAVLSKPGSMDRAKNLTSWVKEHASSWLNSPFRPETRPLQPLPKKQQEAQSVAKKVEAKLADGDVRGAIRLVTSEDSIAPNDAFTMQSLQEKHPPHPTPTNFPSLPSRAHTKIVLEGHQVLRAISSFPPGSAGGLDALRPQIVKDLVGPQQGDLGESLLAAISDLLLLILEGRVPEPFRHIFFGAALTALKKKDGGIRPIAVGNMWRRLAAKLVVSSITPELVELLAPHQLGVGIPGGAEAGSHAARIYWNASHPSIKAFLKLDFRNAFNEIRRDAILSSVATHFPQFYRFVAAAYQSPSSLFFGTTLISSERGAQQGDPMGPALFAITIQPIVQAVKTEFNMWYLDDGSVADSPSRVLNAFDTVRSMSASLGLSLNCAKCEVGFCGGSATEKEDALQRFRTVAPEIQELRPETTCLLGAPLTEEATETVLGKKTKELKRLASKLRHLTAHSAFYLLRASISIPRLIYFLRCSPSWRRPQHLLAYDEALREALEVTLNGQLPTNAWTQASWPVRLGGLGVRRAADVAVPCFLSSANSSSSLVNKILPPSLHHSDAALVEGEEEWIELAGEAIPAGELKNLQPAWDDPLLKRSVTRQIEACITQEDTARLKAGQQPHAGAWLLALPSSQLGTHLPNESFRVACSLRLGVVLCQPHQCVCGSEVDKFGYHGLRCKKSAGRWSRHSAANDILARALQSCGVPALKEPVGCSREDGKRPDGITLIPWSRGKSLVWDYTCVDSFAPSHLPSTSREAGAAAAAAEVKKSRKYSFLLDRYLFVPVAMETTGVWGKDAIGFVKEIGRRLADASGERRSTAFLIQRLSLAVQQGNAAAVMGTLPSNRSFDEIFNL